MDEPVEPATETNGGMESETLGEEGHEVDPLRIEALETYNLAMKVGVGCNEVEMFLAKSWNTMVKEGVQLG